MGIDNVLLTLDYIGFESCLNMIELFGPQKLLEIAYFLSKMKFPKPKEFLVSKKKPFKKKIAKKKTAKKKKKKKRSKTAQVENK